MIHTIVCDLDGTLLDSQAHIHMQSRRALQELSRMGFLVVLASGRSWRSVVAIQRQIGLQGPFIAHNGAYGYDSRLRLEWYRRAVPSLRARQFVSWADQFRVMVRCYLGVGHPVVYNRFDLAHQLVWLRPDDRLVPQLAQELNIDPLEIFLSGTHIVDDFIRQFGVEGDDYELSVLSRTGYREVNICAPGVDKVDALKTLCRTLDIPQDTVLAIGDGLNDQRMIEWAGRGVAIASGHPRTLSKADYVTPIDSPDPVWDALKWALPKSISHSLERSLNVG